MARHRLAAAAALLLTALLTPRAGAADAPLSWHLLDWRLDRALLVSRYLFHDRQPDAPWSAYRETMTARAPADSADVARLAAAGAAARQQRAEGRDQRRRRALLPVLDPALRLRDDVQANRVNEIGDFAWETPGFAEAVTVTLTRLEAAVRHDPLDAESWYHLSWFGMLVGDKPRERRARAGFFAAWPHQDAAEQQRLAACHAEALLDHAWDLREAGHSEACLAWLHDHEDALPRDAASPEVPPHLEAMLLRALVHAERGDTGPALALVQHLPMVDLPSRAAAPNQTYVHQANQRLQFYQRMQSSEAFGRQADPPVHNLNPEWQDTVADNLARQHRASGYLRRWVQAWLALARGRDAAEVRREMGRVELEMEYQPRLAWRWWQDQGAIYEQLGEYDLAHVCWARSAVYRPLFIYYPMGQGRGLGAVHGLPHTGQPYFLAYGTFFVAGSVWSYAANAALACQVEDDDRARLTLRAAAREGLDACIRRGFAAGPALALRGRLSFLDERYDDAERDLARAWELLEPTHDSPGDLALMLGLCHFNDRDWTGARPWLEAFVTREPDAHVGWLAAGLVRSFLGQDAAALEAMNRAVALAPDNATYRYNRGLLHYRLDDRARAAADFDRARELWPDNPQILQMVQVVAEPTRYDLDVAAAPIGMDLPAAQREQLAAELSSRRGAMTAGELSDLLQGDDRSRRAGLQALADRYAGDPTPLNRIRLAQAAALVGDHHLITTTLAASWPGGLTDAERVLLLQADRDLGYAGRAAEVAAGLDWPGFAGNLDVLTVAAVVLMDHDRRQEARRIVDRALMLRPDDKVMLELSRALGGRY
jgi:tetratricopeptide (TPR) repeat protein